MRLRKRVEQDRFDRQAAHSRLPRAVGFATEYIQRLTSTSASSRDGGKLSIDAAAPRFPFFYMARTIYGPLDKSQEEELWAIGQQQAALMRYVIKGGIYRFSASWFLVPQMRRELAAFREGWRQFNGRVYALRCSEEKLIPAMIEPLWEHALKSTTAEAEVGDGLSNMLMKRGFG